MLLHFQFFSEFQVSQSNPPLSTTSISASIPNVFFSLLTLATTLLAGKSRSMKPVAAPKAKRAKVVESGPVVDLTGEDPPRQLIIGVLIQEDPIVEIGEASGLPPHTPINPFDFLNIHISPPRPDPLPPTTSSVSYEPHSSTPSTSSATMSNPVIRRILNGDHGTEVNSGTEAVPPTNPTVVPQTTFTNLITQMEQIVEDIVGPLPEPTSLQLPNQEDQEGKLNLNMADSAP